MDESRHFLRQPDGAVVLLGAGHEVDGQLHSLRALPHQLLEARHPSGAQADLRCAHALVGAQLLGGEPRSELGLFRDTRVGAQAPPPLVRPHTLGDLGLAAALLPQAVADELFAVVREPLPELVHRDGEGGRRLRQPCLHRLVVAIVAPAELAQNEVTETFLFEQAHGHGQGHGDADVGFLLPDGDHPGGLTELPPPGRVPQQEEVLGCWGVVGRRGPEKVVLYRELVLAWLDAGQERRVVLLVQCHDLSQAPPRREERGPVRRLDNGLQVSPGLVVRGLLTVEGHQTRPHARIGQHQGVFLEVLQEEHVPVSHSEVLQPLEGPRWAHGDLPRVGREPLRDGGERGVHGGRDHPDHFLAPEAGCAEGLVRVEEGDQLPGRAHVQQAGCRKALEVPELGLELGHSAGPDVSHALLLRVPVPHDRRRAVQVLHDEVHLPAVALGRARVACCARGRREPAPRAVEVQEVPLRLQVGQPRGSHRQGRHGVLDGQGYSLLHLSLHLLLVELVLAQVEPPEDRLDALPPLVLQPSARCRV